MPSSPKSKSTSPFIITLMRKCIQYKIPYDLMCRLNYRDLLYMVVNYDIDTINEYLSQQQKIKQDKLGYETVNLSKENVTSFLKGGV